MATVGWKQLTGRCRQRANPPPAVADAPELPSGDEDAPENFPLASRREHLLGPLA
jgi:hypothetical protein